MQKEIDKISRIIDQLQSEEEVLKDIDKDKILKIINESSLNLDNISENELVKRIKGILAIEAMSGLLKNLSESELKEFDENVKRRK